MAGIYIHIPFCKQACTYCDFYFTVSMNRLPEYLESLQKEIILRKSYIPNEIIETIYFGGGTPSVLTAEQIQTILQKIYENFSVSALAEITFEANPDDLTPNYLKQLYDVGVNRLSVGIQSFFDDELQRMNRRHTGQQARQVIQNIKAVGFQNFSTDLIYAFPGQNMMRLEENLKIMTGEHVPHISIYQLTYEPGTPLTYRLKKKRLKEQSDNEVLEAYHFIMDYLKTKGYEQYEISNFSIPGMLSKHNSSYWKNIPYVGFGVSAHSYNRVNRQWNVSNLKKYMQGIKNNIPYFKTEDLTETEKYNDYILTALRTKWGISTKLILENYSSTLVQHFKKEVALYLSNAMIEEKDGVLILTRKGKIMADTVCRDLIYVD